MQLELPENTKKWLFDKAESLTKEVMTTIYPNDFGTLAHKIGQVHLIIEILANSGLESYGTKFYLQLPTNEEYAEKIGVNE